MHWDCVIHKAQYQNKRIALELLDSESDESIAIATVNLPDIPLAHDEVFIKDYSEDEGMLQVLVDASIVEETNEVVSSGFVTIPRCKILFKETDFINDILYEHEK